MLDAESVEGIFGGVKERLSKKNINPIKSNNGLK